MMLNNKVKPIAVSIMLAISFASTGAQAAGFGQSKSASASTMDGEIDSAYALLKFQTEMSRTDGKTREELISRSLKLKAMTDYAKSVAIRSGIKARIKTINEVLVENSRDLDAIYDFNTLMIDGKVVPPVISEANNLYNQKNATQINRAQKIFKIERQAKFASTAPVWQEYLSFPVEASAFERYAYVAGEMKPKDSIELKAWQDATVEGWNLGVNQANIILKQGLERLNRDYVGMVRFHQFVMQGKLTMPVINQYNLYDTNNGMTMIIDEDMLRISVLPTFNDQASISTLPQHQLRSDEYVVIEDDAFLQTPKNIEKVFSVKKMTESADGEVERDDAVVTGSIPASKLQKAIPMPDVEVAYSQPIVSSVQNIINDTSTDGRVPTKQPIINKQIKTQKELYEDRQSSVGIYGSQNAKDTLLINVVSRPANTAR